MGQLRVRNWERWQSYRSDRRAPPWIKVHRRVLLDPEFAALSDAERWHLIGIWIIAADRNGVLSDDPHALQRALGTDTLPDLERLLSLQFLERPKKSRRQRDVNVTPRARARVARPDTDTDTELMRSPNGDLVERAASDVDSPLNGECVKAVLRHLNDATGKGFRWRNPAGKPTAHADRVTAILKKGYTVEDMCEVIDRKAREWSNDDKMSKYLTPETLFRVSNFEKYLDG